MRSAKEFDVAIIGAGPAGSIAAIKLARAGVRTAIIDKKKLPRYKTCGGGLVYRAQKHVPVDFSSVVEKEFKTVHINLSKKLQLKTTRPESIISMIMRDSFDHLLTKSAVEAGATLMDGIEVDSVEQVDSKYRLHAGGDIIDAGICIAADGAYSAMARKTHWQKDSRKLIPAVEYEVEVEKDIYNRFSGEVRFDMDAVNAGYGWCFPKSKHLSIGVGIFRGKGKSMRADCEKYMQQLGILNLLEVSKHGYQIPIAPRKEPLAQEGILLTGDAAGLADPLTAEGLSNAIISGSLAAQAVISAQADPVKATQHYLKALELDMLPQLHTAAQLGGWFYRNRKLSNIVLQKHGQRLADYVASIFMGEKGYPHNVLGEVKKRALKVA